jgi:hypothetical protein
MIRNALTSVTRRSKPPKRRTTVRKYGVEYDTDSAFGTRWCRELDEVARMTIKIRPSA